VAGVLDAVVLAVALAMDATAVAGARGAAPLDPPEGGGIWTADAIRIAAVFGGFQAAMAAVGWAAGAGAARWIVSWDHWLAAAILGVLGGRMIVAAWRGGDGGGAGRPTGRELVLLGVATSIDALAAGVTLPLLAVPPVVAIALIGLVTAALSAAGVALGRWLGARVGRPLEVAGGLALVAIGVKIVVEHT
jgi:manganese efflux pump family protein